MLNKKEYKAMVSELDKLLEIAIPRLKQMITVNDCSLFLDEIISVEWVEDGIQVIFCDEVEQSATAYGSLSIEEILMSDAEWHCFFETHSAKVLDEKRRRKAAEAKRNKENERIRKLKQYNELARELGLATASSDVWKEK